MNYNSASILPPIDPISRVYAKNGYNKDIISAMVAEVPRAQKQTKLLAKQMCGRTAEETAHNIFKWLKSEIQYVKDHEDNQVIKQPNALVEEGGDCKSYALSTVGILRNCKLPAYFRFVSYDKSNSTPTHVYAYTTDEQGKKIIIDAVYGIFDEEKPYYFKKDKDMRVSAIGSVDAYIDGAVDNSIGKLHLEKEIMFAPARTAFLALLQTNVRGLASKMKRWIDNDSKQAKKVWVTELGGNWKDVQKWVDEGAKHKPLFGEKKAVKGLFGIGVAPLAALAAAAPVIAVVVKFLDAKGDDPDNPGASSGEELEDIVNDSGAALQKSNNILHPRPPMPARPPMPPLSNGLLGGTNGIVKIAGLLLVGWGIKEIFFSE